MSLLSVKHSKDTCLYLQSLALLNDIQCAYLKGSFLNTKAFLLNLTECFNPLDVEAILDCRWLDNFPNHIFFYSYNHSSLSDCKTHLEVFDYLYLEVSSLSSTLVIITNTNVIFSKYMQAISTAYFWSLGQQVLFSKAPANRTTTPYAKLFIIRLGVAKTTSINIEYIILITDSLSSTRQAVDLLVYSIQALHLYYSFLKAMVIRLTFGTAQAILSGLFTNKFTTM